MEAQDHEQSGAQVTYPGFLLTSTCEFEGAPSAKFTKTSLKMVCQTYHPPNHADYTREFEEEDNTLQFKFLGAGLAGWRLLCWAGAAGLLCRAVGASQPFAKKKRAAPHGRTGIFETLVPPMSRKRGWASPFWASPYSLGEPSNEVGASHQTRLGRAIKRGWGEPSNEVGRASAKGPYSLGELVGRASTKTPLGEPTFTVASVANACLALLRCPLGTWALRLLGTTYKCQLGTCPLGTFS